MDYFMRYSEDNCCSVNGSDYLTFDCMQQKFGTTVVCYGMQDFIRQLDYSDYQKMMREAAGNCCSKGRNNDDDYQ